MTEQEKQNGKAAPGGRESPPPGGGEKKKVYIQALGLEVEAPSPPPASGRPPVATAPEVDAIPPRRRASREEAASEVNPARLALGLLGAAVGGALGFAVFGLLYARGLYALALPGGLLGLGCALASRGRRSLVMGVICGVAALVLSVYTEWHFRYWVDDPSLGYFLSNIGRLSAATWIMAIVGTAVAFWLGIGRERD